MSKQANKEGWIRHRGGKCPVDKGTAVDIRVRSGEVAENCKALTEESDHHRLCAMDWSHENPGHANDIMAYRLHQPEQASAPVEVKAAETVSMPDGYGELISATLESRDGPLQWRDRITEIDRTVEALEEERVSLIQKLADEGLQLIKREAVDLPDMSDWRNWRVGDLMTVTDRLQGHGFNIGETVRIKSESASKGRAFVCENLDGIDRWAVDFDEMKFHSRPTK